jgi:hypothetical protein
VALLGLAAFLVGIWLSLVGPGGTGVARPASHPSPPPLSARGTPSALPAPGPRPPDPAASRDDPTDPGERRRVAEALVDLAEKFGMLEAGATTREPDPTDLMVRLARQLRYRGPCLSDGELADLAGDRGPGSSRDRAMALEWHAQVRRFADDRPLPPGFARGPLRWQLDTLAWSFHLDDPTTAPVRSPAEVPHALADALAIDAPLRPNSLTVSYPALAAYAEFLGRLPRR